VHEKEKSELIMATTALHICLIKARVPHALRSQITYTSRLGPDQLNNAAGITDTESGGHSDAGQRSASETSLELSFRDTQNLC